MLSSWYMPICELVLFECWENGEKATSNASLLCVEGYNENYNNDN